MGLSVTTQALLAGAAFVLVEVAVRASRTDGAPLPVVEVALWAGILGGLHAAFARLARRLGARALAVPVVLWALVWGPDQARLHGWPPGSGYVAPVLLGLVGARAPGLAAGIGLLGAVPLAPTDPPPPDGPPGPHVVLITVDTVRADALLLDQLPEPGRWTRYTQAVAPAPWTPPSMQSLFLGVPVDAHGAGVTGAGGLTGRPGAARSFVEDLARQGFDTEAFVTNPHLRREAGFARGFARWHHDRHARLPVALWHHAEGILRRLGGTRDTLTATRDARVTAAARAALLSGDGRARFTWVHLLGPHEYVRRGGDPQAAYADLVSAAGAAVGALARADPSATLVVTSDHGELLGEGGRWGHGQDLAPELLRVPLAIRSARPGGVVDDLVAVADLADALRAAPAAPVLPARARVRVGGVKEEPARAGWWTADGVVPDLARATDAPALRVDRDTDRALQLLGYVEPAE